ncbi:MAG: carbamate kinase [Planctomycetes bacterium]|nr:carbamate kinase [Planctomycetota bacterium]
MTTKDRPVVLIAMGGHAFIGARERCTVEDHERNAATISQQLMTLVERSYNIVITHGNGPQVGSLLLQNELSRSEVEPMPLDVLVAETEGSLGYILQQSLLNELRRRAALRQVVAVISEVLVDRQDPAFSRPTKPIGRFLTQVEAEELRDRLGWQIVEDAGRGWRRVVPSPRPVKVVQCEMIREAAQSGHIVIACGGGGIPITEGKEGAYEGIEAVIDKDLTSAVLANQIGAQLLIILTAVPNVCVGYKKPGEKQLNAVTLQEIRQFMAGGEFPAGSMGPKIEAVINFLEGGGQRALITNPQSLQDALEGRAGTHFVGRW